MAEIKPLRGWRYRDDRSQDIGDLVSPLFDVVSDKQRTKLYENTHNSLHLSVPMPSQSLSDTANKLEKWKAEGIIVQDQLPAIYVYYQYFSLRGSDKLHVRKGFIANMKIYDWDEEVLLRHENTIPHSVADRIELLDKTQLHVSPTHGLYTDSQHYIEPFLDEAMENPVYETEDYQGVKDVLSIIHDVRVIRKIMEVMKEKQIILADGHHRYEASLSYQKKQSQTNLTHNGTEGYHYHLMYFTNTESDDLRILPTHRLVDNLPNFSPPSFLKTLESYFSIRPIEEPTDLPEILLGKPQCYGLLLDQNAYLITLKPERPSEITWDFPQQIKELDLTLMHYFIFEKSMGILGKHQRGSKHLHFERNFVTCLQAVQSGKAQTAIIAQDISIQTVKEVCYSGYTLPQKSTYFYPKVITGFVFGSIRETEFNSYFDEAFT